MSNQLPEFTTLLENAPHRPDFPTAIQIPAAQMSEHNVDSTVSAAFHGLVTNRRVNPKESYKTALSKIMTPEELGVWFGQRTMHTVDIVLVTDSPKGPHANSTIWFLINKLDATSNSDGYIMPVARRVNGAPGWLAPLCMELDDTVYAANISLQYGSAIRSAYDLEKIRIMNEYSEQFRLPTNESV